jgi:O-antigen/teichoic acid export membrane protein
MTVKKIGNLIIGGYLEQVITLLCGITSVSITAKYLGLSGFGIYSLTGIIISLLGVFIQRGLPALAVIKYNKFKKKKDIISIYSRKIYIRTWVFVSIVVVLVGIISSFVILNKSYFYLSLIIASALFFQVTNVEESLLKYEINIPKINKINSISSILTLFLLMFFVYAQLNLYLFCTIYIIKPAIKSLLLTRKSLIKFINEVTLQSTQITIRQSKRVEKILKKQGLTCLIANMTNLLYLNLDSLTISTFLGVVRLGEFSAAMRIINCCLMVGLTIQSVINPLLIKLKHKNAKDQLKLFRLYTAVLISTSLIITIFVFFSSSAIIKIVYGPEFAEAQKYLIYMSPILLLSNITIAVDSYHSMEEMYSVSMKRCLIGMISNALLNIPLTVYCGVSGTILATILSMIIAISYSLVIQKDTNKLRTLSISKSMLT